MSKIKVLYDVVAAIKEKESCSGNLNVEAKRDGVKIFGLSNDFEKNLGEGKTKAKISLEVDCEGKKVKHESSTEFACAEAHADRRHDILRHMISHHHRGHHFSHAPVDDCHAGRRCGFKEKLDKLAFMTCEGKTRTCY
ncbi:hypothetical protein [Pelotomaculum propionicicum]|uniref:Uncharacterized protein n=1 Tax=Pelotomaculum propionicicum TaxID=258475 RepID=A0A4Y7RYN5_9FIRM|nr:hypothetical protein [Pelotomaculum propionicicum]NLI13567.1 hypothetical protein [Peptococcaceae bacterium]TEB13752.1 hypothetical protein Pmgp_00160 [Pelotomaculum propionicicum]